MQQIQNPPLLNDEINIDVDDYPAQVTSPMVGTQPDSDNSDSDGEEPGIRLRYGRKRVGFTQGN